jgi:hypothetical protein
MPIHNEINLESPEFWWIQTDATEREGRSTLSLKSCGNNCIFFNGELDAIEGNTLGPWVGFAGARFAWPLSASREFQSIEIPGVRNASLDDLIITLQFAPTKEFLNRIEYNSTTTLVFQHDLAMKKNQVTTNYLAPISNFKAVTRGKVIEVKDFPRAGEILEVGFQIRRSKQFGWSNEIKKFEFEIQGPLKLR